MQIKEDEPPKETELEKQMRENWSPDDDKDMEQYAKSIANKDTSTSKESIKAELAKQKLLNHKK